MTVLKCKKIPPHYFLVHLFSLSVISFIPVSPGLLKAFSSNSEISSYRCIAITSSSRSHPHTHVHVCPNSSLFMARSCSSTSIITGLYIHHYTTVHHHHRGDCSSDCWSDCRWFPYGKIKRTHLHIFTQTIIYLYSLDLSLSFLLFSICIKAPHIYQSYLVSSVTTGKRFQ